VRIFEGRIVQTDPKIITARSNAEVHLHATLKEAFDDAESEYKKSIASDRWVPHNQRDRCSDRSSRRVTMIDAASAHLFAPVVSDA